MRLCLFVLERVPYQLKNDRQPRQDEILVSWETNVRVFYRFYSISFYGCSCYLKWPNQIFVPGGISRKTTKLSLGMRQLDCLQQCGLGLDKRFKAETSRSKSVLPVNSRGMVFRATGSPSNLRRAR